MGDEILISPVLVLDDDVSKGIAGTCAVCARHGGYDGSHALKRLRDRGQVRLYCADCRPSLDLEAPTPHPASDRGVLEELERLRARVAELEAACADEREKTLEAAAQIAEAEKMDEPETEQALEALQEACIFTTKNPRRAIEVAVVAAGKSIAKKIRARKIPLETTIPEKGTQGMDQREMTDEERRQQADLLVKKHTAPMRVPLARERTEHYTRVYEFMQLIGQDVPSTPGIPSEETRLLRAKLLLEETLETIREGLGVEVIFKRGNEVLGVLENDLLEFAPSPHGTPSLQHIADGCCDVKVIATGTLIACGLPDKALQYEVDVNNLKKFGPGGYRNEHGKWIKPPDHQPPQIQKIINQITGA